MSQICEAFSCTPEEAMRQDVKLVQDIFSLRRFDDVYGRMKRDKKSLTPEDWSYLEAVDEGIERGDL